MHLVPPPDAASPSHLPLPPNSPCSPSKSYAAWGVDFRYEMRAAGLERIMKTRAHRWTVLSPDRDTSAVLGRIRGKVELHDHWIQNQNAEARQGRGLLRVMPVPLPEASTNTHRAQPTSRCSRPLHWIHSPRAFLARKMEGIDHTTLLTLSLSLSLCLSLSATIQTPGPPSRHASQFPVP